MTHQISTKYTVSTPFSVITPTICKHLHHKTQRTVSTSTLSSEIDARERTLQGIFLPTSPPVQNANVLQVRYIYFSNWGYWKKVSNKSCIIALVSSAHSLGHTTWSLMVTGIIYYPWNSARWSLLWWRVWQPWDTLLKPRGHYSILKQLFIFVLLQSGDKEL